MFGWGIPINIWPRYPDTWIRKFFIHNPFEGRRWKRCIISSRWLNSLAKLNVVLVVSCGVTAISRKFSGHVSLCQGSAFQFVLNCEIISSGNGKICVPSRRDSRRTFSVLVVVMYVRKVVISSTVDRVHLPLSELCSPSEARRDDGGKTERPGIKSVRRGSVDLSVCNLIQRNLVSRWADFCLTSIRLTVGHTRCNPPVSWRCSRGYVCTYIQAKVVYANVSASDCHAQLRRYVKPRCST